MLGAFFTYQLRQGNDITEFFGSFKNFFSLSGATKNKKSPIKVVYKKEVDADHQTDRKSNFQQRLDDILDKINREGIDNLSDEEKSFLEEASKKN